MIIVDMVYSKLVYTSEVDCCFFRINWYLTSRMSSHQVRKI
uniref:Uncharacterized protein n=1 Tax=Anguilla anguilla TaxID=7936 RepID=A0A0E9WTV5_ANGAN